MLGEPKRDEKEVGKVGVDTGTDEKNDKKTKNKRGLISRVWNGLFRLRGNDFEKRLQHISKEEAAILARVKKRSQSWRRTARNLIIFSVLFEVVAVGYAIMTTRSLDLNWKLRASRVLPMFLLPALSSLTYSSLISFIRMRDNKDQKTLERLRAERQAKIDELKERTNYYNTQQLIQKYDPDPAAKAAATTVLASKLGADSGLKVFVGEESKLNLGTSSDVEFVQSSGLRKRNMQNTQTSDSSALHQSETELVQYAESEGSGSSRHGQLVVEHHSPTGPNAHDGGWIARIAALLVGEDPTQSFALICGNCRMHNGLVRKEDFPFITYYCPHCNALNGPKHLPEEQASGSTTPGTISSLTAVDDIKFVGNNASGTMSESVSATSTPVPAAVEGVSSLKAVDDIKFVGNNASGTMSESVSGTSTPVAAAVEGASN